MLSKLKQKINNYKIEILVLILIIFLSFYRSPFILLNGRFVGEEATYHFLFALNNDFIENLFYFIPLAGYYNLVPNILAEIATLLPLELAPFSTVYGSFLILINLQIICLFYNSYFLDTKFKKIYASFLLFASPPFVPEIWLNSLNSQIYLCLTAILILFINNKKNKINYYLHSNIFIASFSGIYSCVLAPFFLIRYYYNKTKYDLTNLAIIICATIIQLSILAYSKFSNLLLESKLEFTINFDMIILFIYNNLARPIFGRQLTHWIYENLNLFSFSIFKISFLLLFFIFAFLIYFILNKNLFSRFKKDPILLSLVFIFILLSAIIFIGSAGIQLGGRYAVLPGSVFLLILLRLFTFSNTKKMRFFFIFILGLSLLSGIYEFRPPTKNVKHQYIKYLDCIECPIWKEEIKKWRKNKNYVVGIWPYPIKNLSLNIN